MNIEALLMLISFLAGVAYGLWRVWQHRHDPPRERPRYSMPYLALGIPYAFPIREEEGDGDR
jgi:hypothetical protein